MENNPNNMNNMSSPKGSSQPQGSNGIAVGGFVVAIVALVLSWVPILNFILAILAIILSIVGINKAKNLPDKKNHGLALAGIIIGGLALIGSIIFIAVAASMAYFGVLSPENLVPDQCTAQGGFSCVDYQASTQGVEIVLRNNLGETITASDFKITYSDGSHAGLCSILTDTIRDGETLDVSCVLGDLHTPREYLRLNFDLTYKGEGSQFEHTASGSLLKKI